MDEYRTALRTNIWKLYVLSAVSTFGFAVPIFIPFQQEYGLSLQQAFLLQAAYALVLVVLEIPSGYLADRWGRRNTILTGSFALFLGMLTYAVTSGFWGFLLAESLLALGISFHSGTTEALTYDSLVELGEEKRYLRVNGHQGFLALGSKAVTSLLVGSLATVSLRLPFWADVLLFGIGILTSLFLVEPHRHLLKETKHLTAMWRICRHAFLRNRALQGILLLYTVVAAIDVQIFWFLQPYQTSIALPLVFFGITNAAMCLLGALAYRYVHLFGKHAERMDVLFVISVILILTCFGMSVVSSLWGLAFFILEGMAFGLFDPLSSNIINRITTSDVRATVLSLRSFTARLLFAALSPLLGYVADVYSLSQALLLTGIIGMAALLLTFALAQTQQRKLD
ncbi:MAG: MFS transporter [Candidatus Peribacteraceae bacterium]|nr:MFS transporter [Candidatus Peribacteraceae bacterium]